MARTKQTARKLQNRVSLGAGDGAVQLAASRKRKLEEELELNESSSDSERDDSTAAVPRTDEEKINLIVTKRLLSTDVEDAWEAMKSLASMISPTNDNFEENQKVAARRGAHLTVVFAMRRNKNNVVLQSSGLGVLVNLSCSTIGNTSTKPDILAVGGLKCCIWAMGRRPHKAILQEVGCLLINNLWNRPELRKSVVDEGGLKAVVKALDNHKRNQPVQRNGCFALSSLLGAESSWSQHVVDAGCIDRVITAMNNHPDDAELQVYGCDFFARLAKAHDDYRTMILQAKGIGSVGEALRIHDGNNKVKFAAQDALKAISA